MKILMVNKFLYPGGGSENHMLGLADELLRQGHEVWFFGMADDKNTVGNGAGQYTENLDFHGGGAGKLLYPFRIIYSREAARKIKKVLEEFKPDAVHFHNINFQLTPSVIDAARAFDKDLRLIATAHDSQFICPGHLLRVPSTGELCRRCVDGSVTNCLKYRCIHDSRIKSLIGSAEGWLYRKKDSYEKLDTVVCPSEFMAEVLSHHPRLKGRLKVLRNFADGPEKKKTAAGGERYILYFGRYGEEKGVRVLLNAVKKLPEVMLYMAGRGELKPEIDRAAKESGNIVDMGFKSGDELKDLIAGASLAVFPSVCHENCPLSVMEAQAAGVPVVASRVGGIPELMDDGRTGELVAPGDADALSESLYRLWNDQDRLDAWSLAAIDLAKERYMSPEEYCREMVKLYGGDL